MKLISINNLPRIFSGTVAPALFLSMLVPTGAEAYVDPGSGGLIVTTILGLIAAIGYTFRKTFYNLKRKITGKDSQSETPTDRK